MADRNDDAMEDMNEDPHDALIEAGLDKPRPEWIVGTCPECGSELVQAPYSRHNKPGDARSGPDGKQWVLVRQCWNSLGKAERRSCGYRVEEGMAGFEAGCYPAQSRAPKDYRN